MLSLTTSLGSTLAATAMSGPEIDINPSFALLQFVVFALLMVVLKPLLYDPILKVFEAREQRTDGARADARSMQEQAGELLRQYEAELAKVSQVASEERDRLRTETAKLEASILEEARAEVAKVVEEGRHQLAGELQALRQQLAASAPAMTRELAQAVVGREVR